MTKRQHSDEAEGPDRGSLKRRVFAASPVTSAQHLLDAESAHHLTRVLRLRAGEEVDLADGEGGLWRGRLTEHSEGWCLQELALVYRAPMEARRVLIAGLIKGPRWEWLVEKVAELGAHELIPVQADRSVVRISPSRLADRTERWQRIADGAARQCERLSRMIVHPPCALAQALAQHEGSLWLVDETTTGAVWPAHRAGEALALAVGPEGGWTPEERVIFLQHGARQIGLGTTLLRAETAAVTVLSLVRGRDAGLING